MKIQHHKIPAFIKQPLNNHIRAILLYGADYGKVNIFAQTIIDTSFINYHVINLTDDDLKLSSMHLADYLYPQSLFAEENYKIICLSTNTNQFIDAIEQFCSIETDDQQKTMLIIKSQELSPSSKLRQLFENNQHQHLLALPCYVDDAKSLEHLINHQLAKHNIKINAENLQLLLSSLGNNYAITLNELDNLIFLTKDKGYVGDGDIRCCITDNQLLSVDKLIFRIFDNNLAISYPILISTLLQYEPIVIVRYLITHCNRLLWAKVLMQEQQLSTKEVIHKLQPPVFFQYINQFTQQLNMWSLRKLKNLIHLLINLEINLKTFTHTHEVLLKQFIVQYFHQ